MFESNEVSDEEFKRYMVDGHGKGPEVSRHDFILLTHGTEIICPNGQLAIVRKKLFEKLLLVQGFVQDKGPISLSPQAWSIY